MSIRFGVALIIFLMLVMMFATQFEASTSTRAMKRFIYGSMWFDAAVFPFVVNIVVNTLRRRPYRFRHIGFLTVHAGVLVIVAGGLTTRWCGVDGTMPIPEGSSAQAISLPENDLVVQAAGQTVRHETHYDLTPWETEHADTYAVPGMRYRLRVDRYYPTGAVTDTLVQDLQEGAPTLRLAVGVAGHEPHAEWLRLGDPQRSELSLGTLRVRVADGAAAQAIRAAWGREGSGARIAGSLELIWNDGSQETVQVPAEAGRVIRTSRKNVDIEVVRVFRTFVLAEGGASDASTESDVARNPALRFRVLAGGAPPEEHVAFANFPEFEMDPPEGQVWQLDRSEWRPAEGVPGSSREILIAHEAPGRWTAWSSWRDAQDGVALSRDETVTLEGAMLRVLEQTEHGKLVHVVVQSSDEVLRPVVLLRLMEPEGRGGPAALFAAFGRGALRRANAVPNEVWLFHGEDFRFDTPEGPVQVAFETRRIPLPFSVHLNDFREEKYPGVELAASYESHVTVQPSAGEPFQEKIYMNHPLKYAGYTFYQASFQRTPDGEVTVLSVARDPGMTLSFVGYCILVGGLVLIFFAKPYLRKLDDRRARAAAPAGAAHGVPHGAPHTPHIPGPAAEPGTQHAGG